MWGNLPNEILSLIVKECGRDCLKVKWMFVNRKWFDFYLSLVYKTISLDFSESDTKVKKIVSSTFKVGNKVKRIDFTGITVPDSIGNLCIPIDCLSVLMKETPNVEEIGFLHEEDWYYKGWAYFSMVLLNTNCWKLRVLPKINKGNFLFSTQYYVCAYRMRHTLIELDLTIGMVGILDFKCLEEFTSLELLRIDKRVVNGVDELKLLLQHTPNLREAFVDFSDDRFESFQSEFDELQNSSFSALKSLELHNFTPKHNDELLVFITNNFMLDRLRIIGEKNSQWPAMQVESRITDIFFDALNTINEYEITIPGNTQETVFKKWLKLMNDSKQKIHLSVQYTWKNVDVEVTIKGGKLNSITEIVYEIGYDHDTSLAKGINILNDIYDKISQVEIAGMPDEIELLLHFLIGHQQVNLKKLVITDSFLNTYSLSETTLSRVQYLKNLKFSKCKIRYDAFKIFMKEFQSLDCVQLDNCSFEGNFINEPIDVSDSIIETISMANINNLAGTQHYGGNESTTIILVSLSGLNYVKYYMILEGDLIKTTENAFKLFCKRLSSSETVLLKMKVKSMKQLLLKPTDTSKEIKINFPQWH